VKQSGLNKEKEQKMEKLSMMDLKNFLKKEEDFFINLKKKDFLNIKEIGENKGENFNNK